MERKITVVELATLLSTVPEKTPVQIGFVDEEGLFKMEITHITTEYSIIDGTSKITIVSDKEI